MELRPRIRELLQPVGRDVRVQDVRIGLIYTAVRLEGDRTGVAYTGFDGQERGCSLIRDLQPLAGQTASDLLDLMGSSSPVETAVALATANALTQVSPTAVSEGDVLDFLGLEPGARVGMVGFFGPLLPKLRAHKADVTVFERDRRRHPDTRPEEEACERLRRFDAALITATSIVNHSADRLLEAARGCREVVLLGASTPLLPAAFEGSPVTALSGVLVTRPEGMLRVVSEGGGTRRFRGLVSKVNLRPETVA